MLSIDGQRRHAWLSRCHARILTRLAIVKDHSLRRETAHGIAPIKLNK
jgi:hypothetical protein